MSFTLSLAQKGALLTSRSDGIGPPMKYSSLRLCSVVPEFLFRILDLASVHSVSSLCVHQSKVKQMWSALPSLTC